MKRLLMGMCVAMFSAGTAYSAGEVGAKFTTWDANSDGVIDQSEFLSGMAKSDGFDVVDTNNDGMIDREEYTMGTWKAYDADNDGMWSQTEAGVWEDSRIRSGGEVSQ